MTEQHCDISTLKTVLSTGLLSLAFLLPLLVVTLAPDVHILARVCVFGALLASLLYLIIPVSQATARLPERVMFWAHRTPKERADRQEAQDRLDLVARYIAVLRGDDQYRHVPIHLQVNFSARCPGKPVKIRISPKWNTTMASMMPPLTEDLSAFLQSLFLQGVDTRRFSRLASFRVTFNGRFSYAGFNDTPKPAIYNTPLTLDDIPNHQRLVILQDLQRAGFAAAGAVHPTKGTDR